MNLYTVLPTGFKGYILSPNVILDVTPRETSKFSALLSIGNVGCRPAKKRKTKKVRKLVAEELTITRWYV